MAKISTVLEHINLREQVFGIRYTLLQRARGFVRTILHRQQLVEQANAGLRRTIRSKEQV
jgi:hypothetical protein